MIEPEHLDESYAGKSVRVGFVDGEMAEVRIPLDRIAQQIRQDARELGYCLRHDFQQSPAYHAEWRGQLVKVK